MVPFGFERQRAIGSLKEAWVTGALSIDTFEFRVARALRATHRERLIQLLADLASPSAPTAKISLSDISAYALVGRHPGMTVELDDDTVSRRHASLRRCGSHWIVRDLNSLNGTTVNGRAVTEARVEPGDRLGFGAVTVSVID